MKVLPFTHSTLTDRHEAFICDLIFEGKHLPFLAVELLMADRTSLAEAVFIDVSVNAPVMLLANERHSARESYTSTMR